MTRLCAFLFILSQFTSVMGQSNYSCPVHLPEQPAFENPLYEKWLSAYDVKSYHLDLQVHNTHTEIEGSASILVQATRDLDTLVLELQNALEISSILYNDYPSSQDFPETNTLKFDHTDNTVFIFLDRTRIAGELMQVRISYGGEAGRDRGFFAGITSATDFEYGFDVTYTLSEPHNASDWFPVKQVLEDKIDSVVFNIMCDKDLLAGSNGLLANIEESGNDHILTWKTELPMAYYLISFSVARYRDFSFHAALPGGDSVLVQNFIYDDNRVLSDWEEEIRMTGPMITSFSDLLVDYPFASEKYGHSMAPMGGGMEHQTMTTLQNFNFYLVAHELAHQWFGDYITCGNWQDIWINEGFASYFEYVAAQELLGQDEADKWMASAMAIALQEVDGSVYVPADQVENSYRLFDYGLTYKKGAALLHMIRYILDEDDLFFSILESYMYSYGNGVATGEDFQEMLEAGSGIDFSCFFEQWYYGGGFPNFKITWEQKGDSLIVISDQSSSSPNETPLFQIPFELEVRRLDGTLQRVRLMQYQNLQEFAIPVEGVVVDLGFDPDNDILETSSVVQKWPTKTSFRFGPNPFSTQLFIQVPNSGPIENLIITNISGKEVLKRAQLDNPASMDLSSLADGAYFLEFTNSSGTFMERIVKVTSN